MEHIYSISSPGASLAIVRFYVGRDEDKGIVRLHQNAVRRNRRQEIERAALHTLIAVSLLIAIRLRTARIVDRTTDYPCGRSRSR